jgi:hypothetical protein
LTKKGFKLRAEKNLASLRKKKSMNSDHNIIEFKVLRGALNPPQILDKVQKEKKLREAMAEVHNRATSPKKVDRTKEGQNFTFGLVNFEEKLNQSANLLEEENGQNIRQNEGGNNLQKIEEISEDNEMIALNKQTLNVGRNQPDNVNSIKNMYKNENGEVVIDLESPMQEDEI